MAYIVKSAGGVGAPVSALSRASWDRQVDVYKLALMGSGDCRRLWNDFAGDSPGIARLIVKSVQQERQDEAAANEKLDGRLREAERLVTKARKPKVSKPRKKSADRDVLAAADLALRRAELNHSDPRIREVAESVYRGRGLGG